MEWIKDFRAERADSVVITKSIRKKKSDESKEDKYNKLKSLCKK